MLIRCWGARGSIPVSGPEYLKYGGDTTCLEIRTKNGEVIVVDAGSGIRRLGNRLLEEGCREFNLLFTHAHWDHILGFPLFRPLYLDSTRIRFHGDPARQGDMKTLLASTMAAPFFPVPFDQVRAEMSYREAGTEPFAIDSVTVRTIALNHPNGGLGFRFEEDGKSFVFLTDNELGHHHRGGRSPEEYAAFAEGADLLLHDAEYLVEEYERRRTWGHSHYLDALELARRAKVAAFGLTHHNQDRADDDVDRMVAHARSLLEEAGDAMACFGVTQYSEFLL